MNRFKPGDKARVIGNTEEGDTYHRFKIGASVTIVNKDGKYDFVCKDKTGAKQVIAARDLEPIEPVQEEESLITKKTIMNRFKPGDKARVIDTKEEVEIMESSGETVFRVFPFRDKHKGTYLIEVWDLEPIEPVQEEESEERWRTIALTLIQENESLESTISRLKSEIEELKRKA